MGETTFIAHDDAEGQPVDRRTIWIKVPVPTELVFNDVEAAVAIVKEVAERNVRDANQELTAHDG